MLTERLKGKTRSAFSEVESTPINEGQAIAKFICDGFGTCFPLENRQYTLQIFPFLADEKELSLVNWDVESGR